MAEESKLGLDVSGSNMAFPIAIIFEPHQDITAYELALVLRYHGRPLYESDWNAMPLGVRRHFRVVK